MLNPTQWSENRLRALISDGTEERSHLEYKRPEALGKTPAKKKEMAKDVSSMANGAGGDLIYGIAESSDDATKHLPVSLVPVNRLQFSREWLEQVVTTNIRPPIRGLLIHLVPVGDTPTDVVYVLEIPESTTAHQVTTDGDFRYYRRHNFQAVPMEDYEIRLVMHRGLATDASAMIAYRDFAIEPHVHTYLLTAIVRSECDKVIRDFKLELYLPQFLFKRLPAEAGLPKIEKRALSDGRFRVIYHSAEPLFPREESDVGEPIFLRYHVDDDTRRTILEAQSRGEAHTLEWRLYADDMPPKRGLVPLTDLNRF